MTYRNARRGAAIAGAVLFAVPLIDVMYAPAVVGATHFIAGALGLALIGLAEHLR